MEESNEKNILSNTIVIGSPGVRRVTIRSGKVSSEETVPHARLNTPGAARAGYEEPSAIAVQRLI